MRTRKDELINGTGSVNSDVNITVNNQKHLKYNASNLNACDNPSVDFRIHTNIELITSKRLKIYLLINTLFTIACISASFIFCYKLYTEILRLQNDMMTLNEKFKSLSQSCDDINNRISETQEQLPTMPLVESPLAQTQILKDFEIKDGNYELMLTNTRQSILNRLRRGNPRGNRRNKEKRRKIKTSGILAAHFKGSLPEIHINNQVSALIGPWYLDNSTITRPNRFSKFHLTEGQHSIEVTEPGLYLIYAQVYYITSSAINSYVINVRSEGSSEDNEIARCSTLGPTLNYDVSEASCYTATVQSLKANDRIFIQQIQINRTITLRDGHSFLGLVKFGSMRGRK